MTRTSSPGETATTLVGMCNPHSSDPADALSPARGGSAGHRLWSMLDDRYGLTQDEYLRGFPRRVNLCQVEWDARVAQTTTEQLLETQPVFGRLVLLGAQVAGALGVRLGPLYEWFQDPDADAKPQLLLRVPHPSGLCRAYNERATRDRVADLLHVELLRNLGLYARRGEVVSCEAGHCVCELVDDAPLAPNIVKSTWFGPVEPGCESPHVKKSGHELLCRCGARWGRGVSPAPHQHAALQLHMVEGWRSAPCR